MSSHRVYFYDDDTFLLEKVMHFIKEGLHRQETVIVVATDQHRAELKTQLMEEKQIGPRVENTGSYVTLDTSSTLALFMDKGWPDEDLFLRVMGHIIESAGGVRPVRIYGEMVGVLCAQGNHLGAIQLERLWNKLATKREFALLCGYASSTLKGADNAYAFKEVCACHSEVETSPPSDTAVVSTNLH